MILNGVLILIYLADGYLIHNDLCIMYAKI